MNLLHVVKSGGEQLDNYNSGSAPLLFGIDLADHPFLPTTVPVKGTSE
jgi:hypothetical protein